MGTSCKGPMQAVADPGQLVGLMGNFSWRVILGVIFRIRTIMLIFLF